MIQSFEQFRRVETSKIAVPVAQLTMKTILITFVICLACSLAHAVYPLSLGVPFPEIDWTFMNVGKSPGIIKEIRGELFLGESLPRLPTFTYSELLNLEFVARPDKETAPIVFPFNRNLTLTEIHEIGVGTTQFCFFGYVKYTDSFQFLHTKGFAFRVHIHPRNLAVPVGGRQYNYSKSEKIPRKYST
jgi:hypothetical protein